MNECVYVTTTLTRNRVAGGEKTNHVGNTRMET
jgi:hypothetical protein